MAIAKVLAQHARAIDRADEELLRSAYHSDGWVDYGSLQTTPDAFAAAIAGMHRGAPLSQHRPSNVWIELRGDAAVSESYVVAWVTLATDGESQPHLVGGRYLDRHTRRDGVWRMQQRNYVLDWIMQYPAAAEASAIAPGFLLSSGVPQGAHHPQDPGNALLQAYASTGPGAPTGDGGMPKERAMDDHSGLEKVIAHQAIVELGCRYARGVDRGDPELLMSAFHDDATMVSGPFNGSAREFVLKIGAFLESVSPRVFHAVTNHWIEIDGATAVGESYVMAHQRFLDEDATDVLTGGRYIDRYERRNERWAITQRTFVLDWSTAQAGKDLLGSGMFEGMVKGSRDREDPVYALWANRDC